MQGMAKVSIASDLKRPVSNAFKTLSAAGVDLISGQLGTVRDALEKYKKGELKSASDTGVSNQYGTSGSGMGRG